MSASIIRKNSIAQFDLDTIIYTTKIVSPFVRPVYSALCHNWEAVNTGCLGEARRAEPLWRATDASAERSGEQCHQRNARYKVEMAVYRRPLPFSTLTLCRNISLELSGRQTIAFGLSVAVVDIWRKSDISLSVV